ncbi:hypothetical protein A4X06_0g9687, partial [Tilletia controversa]
RSVNFDELCALYAVSDACLVTSTRDGMNLVSYEYIACQQERNGVMILSEFAGAAQSLNGSLIVNPWSAADVADAIHRVNSNLLHPSSWHSSQHTFSRCPSIEPEAQAPAPSVSSTLCSSPNFLLEAAVFGVGAGLGGEGQRGPGRGGAAGRSSGEEQRVGPVSTA